MKRALQGRVVTMDDAFRVVADGVVYLEDNRVADVRDAGAPPAPGFEAVAATPTGGTIFPGLMDLHNHLSYNVLRLWDVDKRYENRDRWAGTPTYRAEVTGPMKVLGSSPDLLPSLIRYVECKCLLGGVTTSQGIALFSNQGVRRYYRGVVRNVESTRDAALPNASARIADIETADAAAFHARLLKETCLLLHLSEGTDAAAHSHFAALQTGTGWAIERALAGIHCVALTRADFDRMAAVGASMVWSPLSNLLLYGATARIHDARGAGVKVGLGADWTYSGSKSLLGELRVARAAGEGLIPDREIVAMATRNAAAILGWSASLGSLEPGKRADLLVLDGATNDPYAALVEASETDITLVMIDGVPRLGNRDLMKSLGSKGESLKVGGQARVADLKDPSGDPDVAKVTLKEAVTYLADALRHLPQRAAEVSKGPLPGFGALHEGPPVWFLALDELSETGVDLRPHLPLPDGTRTGASRGVVGGGGGPTRGGTAVPLQQLVHPMDLDTLTMADDPTYWARIRAQHNLPPEVLSRL